MLSPVHSATISAEQISAAAYEWIRNFVRHEAGIDLGPTRQMLVISRLRKRLAHYRVDSFDSYVGILADAQNAQERQCVIDLLSTNETYFFREKDHLGVLRNWVLKDHPCSRPLRIWSAACSSGEEAYSIAMILAESCEHAVNWSIFGSDVSTRMIRQARAGLYPMQRIDAIPQDYRKLYCLKGIGRYTGYFLIDSRIRDRCRFDTTNLVKPLPDLGLFDAIFFRNALIYFDDETKESIVRGLLSLLRPGGLLFIGHSESLKQIDLPLELIAPTAYRKTGAR